MQSYKPLIRKLLILIVIDTLLLAAFVWWMDATPDISIAEVVIVPTIFACNLIAALIIVLLIKGTDFLKLLLLNAFLAPIIFHWLFKLWFIYYDKTHFKKYKFELSGKHYELLLDRRDTFYSLIERLKLGSGIEFKQGHYKQVGDDVQLLDSINPMQIHDERLMHYPSRGKELQLYSY